MKAIFLRSYRLLDHAKSPHEQQDYGSRTLVEIGAYEIEEIPNPYFPKSDNWWILKGTTIGMSVTSWVESKFIIIEH